MKKIINKKTYDTEKATFIGEWDNGESPTDCLDYIQEQLYMTADPDGKSGCPGMAERMLRTAEKKKIQIDF